MSDFVTEAWHHALLDLPDHEGMPAFAAVARSGTFGDVEPAHILQKAAELKEARLRSDAANGGVNPWISKAPKFQGTKYEPSDDPLIPSYRPTEEFKEWLQFERPKRYRSIDHSGNIFLIQNPEAWNWRVLKDHSILFIRAKPEPTGEQLPKQTTRKGVTP
jgi:hypothetical protein